MVSRKTLIWAALAGIAGVLGLYFYAHPAYRKYKEARFSEQARTFMGQSNYHGATLCARQALAINSNDLGAASVMADLAEISHSPHLLDWRRRIAELQPSVENKLKLVRAVLICQGPPYPLAAQTLVELRDSGKDVADYHVVAAEVALKLHKLGQAESQMEKASQLEPSNERHRLNLAVLRLGSTNTATASEAYATLDSLRKSTNVGDAALRWLVSESLRQKDFAKAESFSLELQSTGRESIEDRLQHLRILANKQDFGPYLKELQQSCANALGVYAISEWMLSQQLAGDALQWLTNCPAKLRTEQPVPLAVVDCFFATKDWAGLESYLENEKWPEREFLRLAFLSHAASEQKQALSAEAHWKAAVRDAGDRLGALSALSEMAGKWGLSKEREAILWQIAERFPRERWAFAGLERFYVQMGNTRGLNKVYTMMANSDSSNFVARNNLAATSLLLKFNLAGAHELAKEIYLQHPEQAIIASTYAYSLHLQGRTKEGLATMEKLKGEEIEMPAVALYYGVLLSASGDTNHAAKYLELAKKSDLLPEEKALLSQAGSSF